MRKGAAAKAASLRPRGSLYVALSVLAEGEQARGQGEEIGAGSSGQIDRSFAKSLE